MKAIPRALSFTIGLALCFGVGFSWRDLRSGTLPTASTLGAMVTGKADVRDRAADDVFKLAYNRLEGDYYRDVDTKQLKYAGMEGMMSSLGDPHTLFLPPQAEKDFDQETRGNFVGVGARLQRDPLGAKVVACFEDGPAYHSGMRAGDVITAVDGKSMVGIAVDDIVTHIRGEEGTKVALTLIRPGEEKKRTISVKRAQITTPTVDGQYFKDSGVGYLTVTQFAEPTTMQFDRELDKLEKNPLKGLVIDLRGNPGGLLGTAAEMLSLFVSDKTVVTMTMRDGKEEEARTLEGKTREHSYPVMILINEDSASAAEIFAGVMRDYNVATLVGTHSYGKMSVQNVFRLRDGSGAKITIALYHLPNHEDIERKVNEDGQYISGGLSLEQDPNSFVEAKLDPDDANIVIGDPKTDTQLAKAIEVIKSKG